MSVGLIIRGFAVLFLLLAAYQGYVWFESFRIGAVSPASYATKIALPLFMSIAMQILARKMGKTSGDRG